MPGPQKDEHDRITAAGDMVIYCAGFPAIYGRQPLYFEDETFAARAAIPPPKRSDSLSNLPVPEVKAIGRDIPNTAAYAQAKAQQIDTLPAEFSKSTTSVIPYLTPEEDEIAEPVIKRIYPKCSCLWTLLILRLS
jgi:hypothetical protein